MKTSARAVAEKWAAGWVPRNTEALVSSLTDILDTFAAEAVRKEREACAVIGGQYAEIIAARIRARHDAEGEQSPPKEPF